MIGEFPCDHAGCRTNTWTIGGAQHVTVTHAEDCPKRRLSQRLREHAGGGQNCSHVNASLILEAADTLDATQKALGWFVKRYRRDTGPMAMFPTEFWQVLHDLPDDVVSSPAATENTQSGHRS